MEGVAEDDLGGFGEGFGKGGVAVDGGDEFVEGAF